MQIDDSPVLHHVGYAVKSIHHEAPRFERLLQAVWDGVVHHDPLQKARVTFLKSRHGLAGSPLFELVEGDTEDAPLSRFVAKGGGLHHICYEVENLDHQLTYAKKQGAVVIQSPQPAVAFHGRRIAWTFARPHLLIEYLERTHPTAA